MSNDKKTDMLTIAYGSPKGYMLLGLDPNGDQIITKMEQLGWAFTKAADEAPETSAPANWSMNNEWTPRAPNDKKRVHFMGPKNERITFNVCPPEGVPKVEFENC